ncbi:MAG: sulfurtransferase [Gammaproteobacteria bacterium]
MEPTKPPLILEPEALKPLLGTDQLVVVDLCKPDVYAKMHIPGAVHLDYGSIVRADKPVMGLLPAEGDLSRALSAVGIAPESQVVAYDDEGGGRAARLLWTLECAGHANLSLLNGGLHSWTNEGHELNDKTASPGATVYPVTYRKEPVADADYILSRLNDNTVRLLDTRSPNEYKGIKKFAARGGHIPGAVNLEWTQMMDQNRNLRVKPEDRLTELLGPLEITSDKEIIVYCQTHHRSAYTYIVLKSMGFQRLKGYHGSWSDWGNRTDTPVE